MAEITELAEARTFDDWFAETRRHAEGLPPIATARILDALDADRE